MAGIRGDQTALYLKDMYKAEREAREEVETKYNQVYKVKNNVKGAGDKITQILGAGALRRHTTENQDIVYKSPIQGWEFLVKYHTYSDGIALSKEAVEDSVKLGNLLKELAGTWGKQVRIAKEELAARVFNQGGDLAGDWSLNGTHTGNSDSSGDLCYDSATGLFCLDGASTEHVSKGGTSYYNSIASLTVIPSDFERLYNLHTATNNRDERDNIVRNPADTILVRPGSDRFAADRIVDTSRGMPSSQINDKNPYYKIVSVIDWDYLVSTGGFYVGKKQADGFQFHERQKPEIRFFRNENNLGYLTSINIRIGVLIKDWRPWTRGGGTAA